jgi:hypothetical protein
MGEQIPDNELSASEIRHPRHISMTCLGCGDNQVFRPADGDPGARVVIYACPECGHQARLDMDP